MCRHAGDFTAHRRITAELVCVIDVLVSSEPPEYRLPELGNHRVATIPACPGVGEDLAVQLGQAKGVVEFPEGEQLDIGGDLGAVECNPQIGASSFTRHPISMHRAPNNHHHVDVNAGIAAICHRIKMSARKLGFNEHIVLVHYSKCVGLSDDNRRSFSDMKSRVVW